MPFFLQPWLLYTWLPQYLCVCWQTQAIRNHQDEHTSQLSLPFLVKAVCQASNTSNTDARNCTRHFIVCTRATSSLCRRAKVLFWEPFILRPIVPHYLEMIVLASYFVQTLDTHTHYTHTDTHTHYTHTHTTHTHTTQPALCRRMKALYWFELRGGMVFKSQDESWKCRDCNRKKETWNRRSRLEDQDNKSLDMITRMISLVPDTLQDEIRPLTQPMLQ